MYFKDLKQNYVVYIFDKQNIKVRQGKVINVSLPHFDSVKNAMHTNMVVDLTVEEDGKNSIYTLKEDTDTGYTDTAMITTDKQNIIREIEMGKSQSEETLSQVEMHKDRINKYSQILAEFNPAIKEKQEIDARFGKLETSINDIKTMLSGIANQNV